MSDSSYNGIGLTGILVLILIWSLFWGGIVYKGKKYNADCSGFFEVEIIEE